MRIFWSNFIMISKNFPTFLDDIWKFMLLQAKLSLRACLAMCLIFRENSGSRACKRVAYKKMCIQPLRPTAAVYCIGMEMIDPRKYRFIATDSLLSTLSSYFWIRNRNESWSHGVDMVFHYWHGQTQSLHIWQ